MTNTDKHTLNDTDYTVVAVLAGVHGVKGLVKVKTFTQDPESVFEFSLFDKEGKSVKLVKSGLSKGTFIAKYNDINDRDVAMNARGTELFMKRSDLPELGDGEYYNADLIGMTVQLQDTTPLGVVTNMHNFGAGDLVEVLLDDTQLTEVYQFENDVVSVDMETNIMTIELPVYIEADGDKEC